MSVVDPTEREGGRHVSVACRVGRSHETFPPVGSHGGGGPGGADDPLHERGHGEGEARLRLQVLRRAWTLDSGKPAGPPQRRRLPSRLSEAI